MRTPVYLRAIVFTAAALGAYVTASPSGLGIAPAEAKAFYTRKRVNGEWITGRFAKHHAAPRRKIVARAARTRAVTSTGTLGRSLRAEAAPVPEPRSARVAAAEPAPVPEPRPARVAAAEPAPSATLAPTADERLAKLQEALQARASSIATGSTAAATVGLLPQAAAAPVPAPNVAAVSTAPTAQQPRSVSLDFETGVKTTLFTDGATVKERFDIASLKGLASPPPAEAPAATAPELKKTP